MAAELGFEPRMNESESLVLPLHHSASFTFARLLAQPTSDIIYEPRRFVNKFRCKLNVKQYDMRARSVPSPLARLLSEKAERTQRGNGVLRIRRGRAFERLAAQRADDPMRHG